ncbi:MAG: tagaturonate epimerase family protein [Bacteroidales bacterium]|nr:tagaturonate epimerase family protein [Bacteroidales bacterium]MCF8406102.1 tagaturonate epimerase family protein [Bacteroidales bacterium]
MKKIEKYSFGIGDRFGLQGRAQLAAIILAKKAGISIVPVWNKSNREHKTIGTQPSQVRVEANNSVAALAWKENFYVDADHINLTTVDGFIDHSDFFTLDVADFIGKKAETSEIENFISQNEKYIGELKIDGIDERFNVRKEDLIRIGENYLYAIKHASSIYKYLVEKKGAGNFITEVSMDEVDTPQTPLEMFFILSALAAEKIPAQTIAPKFSGRFNKGVDYVGDVKAFEKEFEQDLLVIQKAIKEFGLPENLKLSVHSGSDKFSIYPIMGKLIKKYDKGIHVKTAGTTWLEEVIGLSMAGGKALEMAKDIYRKAYSRQDELCGPYASVIDIDQNNLPSPEEVDSWNSEKFSNSLRHIPDHPDYNLNFRQLIHVGYKVAAELGDDYINMLKKHEALVATQVTENIFDRHIKRMFNL